MNTHETQDPQAEHIGNGTKLPEVTWRRPGKVWRGPRYVRTRKRGRDLLAVTGQLAAIVRSNAPMITGLEAAAVDALNDKVEAVLLTLRDDLAAGLTLTEAMRKRTRFFPRYYTDLVEAGEKTGKLYESLSELADGVLRVISLQDTLRNYLCYIAAVLTLQLTIVLFICIKVMPVFDDTVQELAGIPAGLTGALTTTGEFIVARWRVTLVAALLVVGFCLWLPRTRGPLRRVIGRLVMWVPWLRGLATKSNLAHAAVVLEKLLGGGVPLDAALAGAASLDLNPLYAKVFSRLAQSARNGETLGAAMERERRLLPATFRGLVSVGEASGLLPEALAKVGGLYGREVARTSRILLDTVTPLCVVALGSISLLVTLAVFQMNVGIIDAMIAAM